MDLKNHSNISNRSKFWTAKDRNPKAKNRKYKK